MTTNAYITLSTSNANLIKRFRVIEGGYSVIDHPMQDMKTTLDGNVDISQGGIYTQHIYTFKVRETESDNNYGNKADLETLFRLKNPNATPSDHITMTDHFGRSHTVIMLGDHAPKPISVIIEGIDSYFLIQIALQEV